MSREGNGDILKIVCMLKPRDAQPVTSLMLKRELENVRRELRNLNTETGQHENKRENTTGEMTMYKTRTTELDMPHMIRGAKCVSRCEECQHTRERLLRKLRSLTTQQSRTVNKVQKSRSWSVLAARRNVCESLGCCKHAMETFQCTVIKKRVCVKWYTAQREDSD